MIINLDIVNIINHPTILIIFKVLFATLMGTLIGKERKRYEKPGGARTFALVSLSACLIAILTLELHKQYEFDFVRLLSYGIASMGFLGSGVIIKNNNKVEGITTASSLFALMLLGYFIGLGYYTIAIITAITIYSILESKKVKPKKNRKQL